MLVYNNFFLSNEIEDQYQIPILVFSSFAPWTTT